MLKVHITCTEDIRTSLAQATTLINTLAQLNTTPLSPSAPGSTAAKTATAKRDKARIELMNDLVSTFESNIRVRYMVDTDRIADVYVFRLLALLLRNTKN